MSGHDARVRDLVAEGRITLEEGERLQRALQSGTRPWTIVRNPVEYLRPAYAILAAIAVVAVSLAISQLGFRFDGALDVHRVPGTPPWSVALFDQVVAIPLTALVLWVASLLVVRQGRLQDFVVVVAVGRLPALLLAIWAVIVLPEPPPLEELIRLATSGQIPLRVHVASISFLPFLVWMFVWLYRGFALSAGMRGVKAAVTFIFAIVVAEILSKLALVVLVSRF